MQPTLKHVATLAGVTPSVVSRVVNGDTRLSIREETRSRILKIVEELGYRPNAVARSLRLKTTESIAMVLPDIANPFFSVIIKGAQKAASERGISLILCDTEEDPVKERNYIELLAGKRTDGILLASISIEDETLDLVNKYHIPYILVNRTTGNANESYVMFDDVNGAIYAVEHLISLGHRSIAHIAGLLYTATGLGRLEGYRKTLKKYNINFASEYVVETEFKEEGGFMAMKKLLKLKKPPTSVFAANDLIALGALAAISDEGLSVPGDISIVGFNDIWIAKSANPPLTTVRCPLYDMGYIASEILINKIKGVPIDNDKVVLKTELITRNSTSMI